VIQMAQNKDQNEMSLSTQAPQQISIRASLVSRGLLDISKGEHTNDMYSWLANFPRESTLMGLTFLDQSDLPSDHRDLSLWGKHSSEMSGEEMQRELLEDRCSGLPTSRSFRENAGRNMYAWRGYIEIEGIHPFERSLNLIGGSEKEILLSAVGVLVRRLLVGYSLMHITCDGDTLLQFSSANLEDVQDFIAKVNSDLSKTVAKIRKPDGTIAERQSGINLVLTEHHCQQP
jgi:hypothetical protein